MTEERTYIDAPKPPTELSARWSIRHGREFPFDGTDEWWFGDSPNEPVTQVEDSWSVSAARGIIAELRGRRGIKQELGFHVIDEDVRAEIIQTIALIIEVALKDSHEKER